MRFQQRSFQVHIMVVQRLDDSRPNLLKEEKPMKQDTRWNKTDETRNLRYEGMQYDNNGAFTSIKAIKNENSDVLY